MTAQTKKTKTATPIIKLIALDQLDANPHNPRDLPSVPETSPGLVALADSLRSVGVLQPLNVRAQAGKKKGRYMILAGHRRALAARLAGLAAVPCYVDDAKTAERQLIAPLAENLAREGLPALHIVEQIAKLKDDGANGTKIAAAIGRSQAFVSKALRVARWLAENPDAQPEPDSGMDALYMAATAEDRQRAIREREEEAERLEEERREAADRAKLLDDQRRQLYAAPAWVDPVDAEHAAEVDADSGDQLQLPGLPPAPVPTEPDRLAIVEGYIRAAIQRHGLDIELQPTGPDSCAVTVRGSIEEIARVAHTLKVYMN